MRTPSGYLTVCHGKSPFLIGKPSINGQFPMAMLNNQRVYRYISKSTYLGIQKLGPNFTTSRAGDHRRISRCGWVTFCWASLLPFGNQTCRWGFPLFMARCVDYLVDFPLPCCLPEGNRYYDSRCPLVIHQQHKESY